MSLLPWSSSTFYFILSSSLMGVMGISLITPVLPDLRAVFTVSDIQIGLVITAYTIPGVLMTPAIGLAADRFSRRRVLIPLLFLFGITGGSISFAGNFTEVIVLRFFQGIGATALVTLAVTLIGDFYQGGQRDAVMGVNASMLSVGAALYPLIGGLLGSIRWNLPFLFFGISILVGLAAIFTLDEPEKQQVMAVSSYVSHFRDVLFLPKAIALLVAIFAAFLLFYGGIQTALPFLLSDSFNQSAKEIGIMLAVVSVANAVVSSLYRRFSQWRPPAELVALGFAAYGTSFVGIWLSPSPLYVGMLLLLFGIGFGLIMPSIDTTLVTLVSKRFRAGMMGIRTSMIRLGQTIGPLLFTSVAETGFVSTVDGYRSLMVTSGLLALVVGVLSYVSLRRP